RPRSLEPWGRRSPAPARPCSSGPPGRTPAMSPPRWSGAALAGPRSGGCRSRRWAPTFRSSSDGLGRPDRTGRAGAGRAAGLGDGDPPGPAAVADPDRHRRPAADPPGPPRLRDDGPDPDRGRPRGAGPADRDRRRAGLRDAGQPLPLRPACLPPRRGETGVVPGSGRGLVRRCQRRARCGGNRRARVADPAARIAAMPRPLKSKLLVALAAVTALFALPAAAGATLTYVKNPMNP